MVDVAARASISMETLRKIETGRSPTPEFFTIVRICRALGITTDALLQVSADASVATAAAS